MEEVLRHKDDLEGAAERFWRFGQLQEYLFWRADRMYNIETGRLPPTERRRIAETDKRARGAFAIFWRTKKSRGHWQKTWCGKTVRDLSEASKNPMRARQYETIYAHASAIAHGGPTSVTSSSTYYDEEEAEDTWIGRMNRSEEHGLRLVATLSSLFLFELLVLVGDRLPDYDAGWVLETFPRLVEIMWPRPVAAPGPRA